MRVNEPGVARLDKMPLHACMTCFSCACPVMPTHTSRPTQSSVAEGQLYPLLRTWFCNADNWRDGPTATP